MKNLCQFARSAIASREYNSVIARMIHELNKRTSGWSILSHNISVRRKALIAASALSAEYNLISPVYSKKVCHGMCLGMEKNDL
jgi:hypothetical protein